MKQYVICVDAGADRNAATKARQDAERIILSAGYEPLRFSGERTASGSRLRQIKLICQTLVSWNKLVREAEKNSRIVLQYPFFPIKSVYLLRHLLPRVQKKKALRFIALIHDINSLRGFYGKAAEYSDAKFLPLFDRIISHNPRMTEYLTGAGIPKDKITDLGIFDYLTEEEAAPRSLRDGLAVAGNLDPEKSGYIYPLARAAKLPLHLYGLGVQKEKLPDSVRYHGSFPPETLPGKIEGAFGVIWDGPSAQACQGATGNYLRYNNPHKLSLYMASGLPVIIWEEAAEAEFVKSNGVGLLVDRLSDAEEKIAGLTELEYRQMVQNVSRIGQAVREGRYLTRALEKAAQAAEK